MEATVQLKELKQQIRVLVRSNSDRGFLHYSGCNRVCAELSALAENAERHPDRLYTVDVQLLILLEAVKLISHADTSSGMVTDVIRECLYAVDQLCRSAEENEQKYFFDAILKTVKNKAFKDWAEFAYELLRSSVYFVHHSKQAEKVYAMFPILGPMYSGQEYPAMYLITYSIMLKLDTASVANQYLMEHIEVDELRIIAVENSLQEMQYELVEQLCTDAMETENRRSSTISKWALYLERVYTETSATEKLIELFRKVLFEGDASYYSKLKELYISQGLWNEELKVSLLSELSNKLLSYSYAKLLDEEGEYLELLGVVERHPYLIEDFGKSIAKSYPEPTSMIYEQYILKMAAEANDRRGYKVVCKLIKGFSDTGSKHNALVLIEKLLGMYPRRPAMLDELAKLKKKLA